MKRYLGIFLIITGMHFFLYVPSVIASDFSLKCDEDKCTPSSITSFFDGQVLWYPTYSAKNTVTVTNRGDTSQYVGHRA
ncbi:MAG: hypothetical protein O3B87_01055 [bacterium]|nr:hypothetical protein [bacterium]